MSDVVTKEYKWGVVIVDRCDADLLRNLVRVNGKRGNSYCYLPVNSDSGKTLRVLLHRVIVERVLGRPLDKNELVDHIDNNGLNNVRSNLRPCTNAQNNRNAIRRLDNTSGLPGVSWDSVNNRWKAYITVDGKQKTLGRFKEYDKAVSVRLAAVREHHGEFANDGFGALVLRDNNDNKAG